jgi:hypothetical protein
MHFLKNAFVLAQFTKTGAHTTEAAVLSDLSYWPDPSAVPGSVRAATVGSGLAR